MLALFGVNYVRGGYLGPALLVVAQLGSTSGCTSDGGDGSGGTGGIATDGSSGGTGGGRGGRGSGGAIACDEIAQTADGCVCKNPIDACEGFGGMGGNGGGGDEGEGGANP